MKQILMLFLMMISIAVFCIPPVASIANDDDQATTDLLLTVAVLNEQAPVVFQKDYSLNINAEDKDIGQMQTITGNTGNIYSYSLKKVGEIRKTDWKLDTQSISDKDGQEAMEPDSRTVGMINSVSTNYLREKVGEIRKTDFQLLAVQLNNLDVKSIDVAIFEFEADYFFWQRV